MREGAWRGELRRNWRCSEALIEVSGALIEASGVLIEVFGALIEVSGVLIESSIEVWDYSLPGLRARLGKDLVWGAMRGFAEDS